MTIQNAFSYNYTEGLLGKSASLVLHENGRINWDKLKESPPDLLRVYLRAKNLKHPGWESLEDSLKQDPKRLVGYHFIKLACHAPVSFKIFPEDIREAAQEFRETFLADPDNQRLQKQAHKISGWTAATGMESIFKMKLRSKDNEEVTIDRFLWATKATTWRPQILGHSGNPIPVQQSARALTILNDYMVEGMLPSRLNLSELLEVYRFGRLQEDQALQNLAITRINEETSSISLLQDKNGKLIVRLEELSDSAKAILKDLRPYIHRLLLLRPAAIRALAKQGLPFNRLSVKLLNVLRDYLDSSQLPKKLSVAELIELHHQAEHLPELKTTCATRLKNKINKESIIPILDLALGHEHTELIAACEKFVRDNIASLTVTSIWALSIKHHHRALQNICSLYLENNLHETNVLETLEFADRYRLVELYSACRDFIENQINLEKAIDETTVFEALSIAEKFNLIKFRLACLEFLENNISADSVVPILTFASDNQLADLRESCIRFVEKNLNVERSINAKSVSQVLFLATKFEIHKLRMPAVDFLTSNLSEESLLETLELSFNYKQEELYRACIAYIRGAAEGSYHISPNTILQAIDLVSEFDLNRVPHDIRAFHSVCGDLLAACAKYNFSLYLVTLALQQKYLTLFQACRTGDLPLQLKKIPEQGEQLALVVSSINEETTLLLQCLAPDVSEITFTNPTASNDFGHLKISMPNLGWSGVHHGYGVFAEKI